MALLLLLVMLAELLFGSQSQIASQSCIGTFQLQANNSFTPHTQPISEPTLECIK